MTEDGEAFWARLNQVIGDEKPFVWAKRVGIPSGTFSRIYSEKTVPKGEHLVRIWRATGVDLNWLLSGQPAALDTDRLATAMHAADEAFAAMGVAAGFADRANATALFYGQSANSVPPAGSRPAHPADADDDAQKRSALKAIIDATGTEQLCAYTFGQMFGTRDVQALSGSDLDRAMSYAKTVAGMVSDSEELEGRAAG